VISKTGANDRRSRRHAKSGSARCSTQELRRPANLPSHRSYTELLYIDSAKAFDVVPHEKLFARLYLWCIRGAVLLWMKNFFSARTHHTKVGSFLSDTAALISGVDFSKLASFIRTVKTVDFSKYLWYS